MDKLFHLYIHLPFCARRCDYCDFFSEAKGLKRAPGYVAAMLDELLEYNLPAGQLNTIYLGGGTPTLIGTDLLEKLLAGVLASAENGAEVTVEGNPSTISGGMAARLRSAGVNRVSLGVQSFEPRLRENLGRTGRPEEVGRAVGYLREAGFDNIGLDLIFGMPGQKMDDLRFDLEAALALRPEHISYYELTAEEGSPYRRRWAAEMEAMEPQGRLFYETVVETLEAAGYCWYETSNFALQGRECRHNLAYWDGADYIGIGAGAWSTVGEKRWQNTENIDDYLAGAARGGGGGSRVNEALSSRTKKREKLMLGLRKSGGVRMGEVAGAMEESEKKALLRDGFLISKGDKITLTRAGRFVANEVCARLLR